MALTNVGYLEKVPLRVPVCVDIILQEHIVLVVRDLNGGQKISTLKSRFKLKSQIVDPRRVIIRKWGRWGILMTFHDAASLHLYHVFTVDVVILDELFYVDEVGCSFDRDRNLSVIPDLTVHLSLQVDNVLLPEAAVHDLALIVSPH